MIDKFLSKILFCSKKRQKQFPNCRILIIAVTRGVDFVLNTACCCTNEFEGVLEEMRRLCETHLHYSSRTRWLKKESSLEVPAENRLSEWVSECVPAGSVAHANHKKQLLANKTRRGDLINVRSILQQVDNNLTLHQPGFHWSCCRVSPAVLTRALSKLRLHRRMINGRTSVTVICFTCNDPHLVWPRNFTLSSTADDDDATTAAAKLLPERCKLGSFFFSFWLSDAGRGMWRENETFAHGRVVRRGICQRAICSCQSSLRLLFYGEY